VVTLGLQKYEWHVNGNPRFPCDNRGQSPVVVVKASVSSVFCSSSCAFAEPVAGLALAERFTERTCKPFACASRSSLGKM
jgi:hypothetical protein